MIGTDGLGRPEVAAFGPSCRAEVGQNTFLGGRDERQTSRCLLDALAAGGVGPSSSDTDRVGELRRRPEGAAGTGTTAR